MQCAHVFHRRCIEEYVECSNKTLQTGCPFKCHRFTNDIMVDAIVEATVRQRPASDDDDDDGAQEVEAVEHEAALLL